MVLPGLIAKLIGRRDSQPDLYTGLKFEWTTRSLIEADNSGLGTYIDSVVAKVTTADDKAYHILHTQKDNLRWTVEVLGPAATQPGYNAEEHNTIAYLVNQQIGGTYAPGGTRSLDGTDMTTLPINPQAMFTVHDIVTKIQHYQTGRIKQVDGKLNVSLKPISKKDYVKFKKKGAPLPEVPEGPKFSSLS